jgi:RNA polymerase sigma-70 factor (ECF subfamily)
LLLSELEACIPSATNVEDEVAGGELSRAIDAFLKSCNPADAAYFIRRYWYGDSVATIAKRYNAGESKVKVSLFRTRKKLRIELEQGGISI